MVATPARINRLYLSPHGPILPLDAPASRRLTPVKRLPAPALARTHSCQQGDVTIGCARIRSARSNARGPDSQRKSNQVGTQVPGGESLDDQPPVSPHRFKPIHRNERILAEQFPPWNFRFLEIALMNLPLPQKILLVLAPDASGQ